MSGVTPTGFDKKTLDEILTEIEDDERANLDASLNLEAPSVFSVFNGIYAERLEELWDIAEAVYNAQYPDSANDAALDQVASITGATRLAATKSTVNLTLAGTPATLLTAGRVVSVVGTGDRFVLLADATIGGGGTVTADFESEEFGPIAAPSGTLTVIETPVTGWDTATNPLDATLGRNIESDADFRARRLQLLQNAGSATLEGIRSNVRAVDNVLQAFVFENTTLLVDADGLPGKSFEVVVEGGLDADIASTIFLSKPVGIESFGSTTVAVIDSQGFSHDIEFSRPVTIDIFIEITVKVDPLVYGGGSTPVGEALVKAEIVELGDESQIGQDVIALLIKCVPLEAVAGVLDVTAFAIGTAVFPTLEDNIVIGNRELALFDTSRIVVTTVT